MAHTFEISAISDTNDTSSMLVLSILELITQSKQVNIYMSYYVFFRSLRSDKVKIEEENITRTPSKWPWSPRVFPLKIEGYEPSSVINMKDDCITKFL